MLRKLTFLWLLAGVFTAEMSSKTDYAQKQGTPSERNKRFIPDFLRKAVAKLVDTTKEAVVDAAKTTLHAAEVAVHAAVAVQNAAAKVAFLHIFPLGVAANVVDAGAKLTLDAKQAVDAGVSAVVDAGAKLTLAAKEALDAAAKASLDAAKATLDAALAAQAVVAKAADDGVDGAATAPATAATTSSRNGGRKRRSVPVLPPAI